MVPLIVMLSALLSEVEDKQHKCTILLSLLGMGIYFYYMLISIIRKGITRSPWGEASARAAETGGE
jgi:hypothetical protein